MLNGINPVLRDMILILMTGILVQTVNFIIMYQQKKAENKKDGITA